MNVRQLSVWRPGRGQRPEDHRSRAEYRQRLRDLQTEIAEAEEANDVGRVQCLWDEVEALEAQLPRRKDSGDLERLRKRVGNAITRAVNRLAKLDGGLDQYLPGIRFKGMCWRFEPPRRTES